MCDCILLFLIYFLSFVAFYGVLRPLFYFSFVCTLVIAYIMAGKIGTRK